MVQFRESIYLLYVGGSLELNISEIEVIVVQTQVNLTNI